VEGACERSNEPPGSIMCWKTNERLHNLAQLHRVSELVKLSLVYHLQWYLVI
jgi:hypothetical protein